MTLKAYNHTAEMRTNLNLLSKSKTIPRPQFHQIYAQTLLYLEQRNLNYPPLMLSAGLNKHMSLKDKKSHLQIVSSAQQQTEAEIEFEKYLEQSAANQRKSNWLWRVGAATVDLQKQGWYPFFVTLTVDPNYNDPRTIWKDGDAFRHYLRKINLVVTRSMGHRPAHKTNVPTSNYVRYFGVLEHGKSRKHDHMHLLLWMREIPESWKRCPNRGIRNPELRNKSRCLQLETYWPYANRYNRPAMYFRTIGDVWEKLGFSLPWDHKKSRSLSPAPPEKAGAYLAKYMGKDEKEWNHRVHATRGLGMEILRDRLQRLSIKKLEALTWRPHSQNLSISVTTIHTVPIGLVRSLAKQIHWSKKYAEQQLNWPEELRKNFDSFSLMRESVKAGARPSRMPSLERYDWVTQHLPEHPGYCEKRLRAAHSSLRYLFPEPPSKKVNRIGITYV